MSSVRNILVDMIMMTLNALHVQIMEKENVMLDIALQIYGCLMTLIRIHSITMIHKNVFFVKKILVGTRD